MNTDSTASISRGHAGTAGQTLPAPRDWAATAGGAPREHPSSRDVPCPHPARWPRAPARSHTRHTLQGLCHKLNCFEDSFYRENRWQQLGSSDYY